MARQYSIGDIRFGAADAYNEIIVLPDFDNYFYNHSDNYKQILLPNKFLILEKKGSGKSILAANIKKKESKKENMA